MFRENTKRDSRKDSLKKNGGNSDRKSKEITSKTSAGASKSSDSAIDKREHISDTGPEFIDFASVPALEKPLVLEPESFVYVDSNRSRTTTWDSREASNSYPGYSYSSTKDKSRGPWSASTTESHTEQPQLFSATSSFSTNMSDPPDYGHASETQYLAQGRSDNALDPRIHGSDAFSPGKVVKLLYLDESQDMSDGGSGDRLSYQEFVELESAREGKIERFVLYKTFPDYSMAVRIYSDDPASPKESSRCSHDQAFIYTDTPKPSVQADQKPHFNPPIHVKLCDGEELPIGSRLDYSDVFIVEHNLPVAFVGQITSMCWDAFASTFHSVQSRITGHDVTLPTTEVACPSARCSYDISPGEKYVPPSADNARPLASRNSQSSGSRRQLERLQSDDLAPVPQFVGPSSPDSDTSEMTSTSSTGRTSADQHATGYTSWLGSYGSEAPINQFRDFGLSGTKAETIKQDTSSPRFAGLYTGHGYGGMGIDNEVWQMQQRVGIQAYTNQAQINSPREWIDTITYHGREVVKALVRPKLNETVEEAVSNLRDLRKPLKRSKEPKYYAASRVKVAILDTNVDSKSEVFFPYKARIKEFKDFVGDGERPAVNTHGTHVASLFLHIAQEADVFLGRAFDEITSLTKAIRYATGTWKVDVISISGGINITDVDMCKALRYANNQNVSIFAATHNDGGNKQISFPARSPYVYPVSSSDFYGKTSASAGDPLPSRANYCTLGENIDPFWMEPLAAQFPNLSLQVIDGSSLATPIAAAILATTLLCARLAHDGWPYRPLPAMLETQEAMNGLLRRVSNKSSSTGYLYVQPCVPGRLWCERRLKSQYEKLLEDIADNIEIQ